MTVIELGVRTNKGTARLMLRGYRGLWMFATSEALQTHCRPAY